MARRVIALLGQPLILDAAESGMGAAAEAITPGHVVAWNGSGGVIKNTANGANVARHFALERDEMGNDIDDAYAIGDQVKVGSFHQGCRVYGFIASGANVTKGDYLSTDNAGRLTKTAVSATIRIAQAVESVDNSAGPGDARIRAQIV